MSFWRTTMVYLGLVDEEPGELPPTAAVQKPVASVPRQPRPMPSDSEEEIHRVGGGMEPLVGRRVEPPMQSRRTVDQRGTSRMSRPAEDGTVRSVRPVNSLDRQPEVLAPHSFDDAKALADHIRERTPVVLNLREAEPDLVRRIVDFATGLTYALDGSMRKIGTGVILVLPPRITLGREEKRFLADMGLYELEIEGR